MLLLVLALYFIQEGHAQQVHRNVFFFVKFPLGLLPLAYAAALILVPNFAITTISLLRGLFIRRWPWVTTAISAVLLAILFAKIGSHGVWLIINPSAAR